jgi:hypothetical protein
MGQGKTNDRRALWERKQSQEHRMAGHSMRSCSSALMKPFSVMYTFFCRFGEKIERCMWKKIRGG